MPIEDAHHETIEAPAARGGVRVMGIQEVVIQHGNQTKPYTHAGCAIVVSLLFFVDIIAGKIKRKYMFLNRRFCGRVVCYRCSASRYSIPRDRIVQNPFSVNDDIFEHAQLHRVCDRCVPHVLRLTASLSERPIAGPSVGAVSIVPSAVEVADSQGTPGSELDDAFLLECPVCRTDLRLFGDDDLQAIHVATCLEGHSTSPPFSGGSRHLGKEV